MWYGGGGINVVHGAKVLFLEYPSLNFATSSGRKRAARVKARQLQVGGILTLSVCRMKLV